MRRFNLIVLILCLFFSVLGALWIRQSGSEAIRAEYQKIAPFSDREMRFYSSSGSLTGGGIIFYRPVFPKLPLRFKADHLQLWVTPLEIRMHFAGVVADIAQSLLARDGADLADTLKSFSPPDSFVTQPLEALALLNRDIFRGSVSLNLRPYGENTQLIVTLYHKGDEVLRIRTTVRKVPDNGLWSWTRGMIQTVTLTLSDRDLGRALAEYYRSARRPVPNGLRQLLDAGTPYDTIIHLNTPIQVSAMLKRF